MTEQKLNLLHAQKRKAHGKKHGAQRIVVGFVVRAQRTVVECLRLDSGLPIITADFAQSLQTPSLRQQKKYDS